MLGNREFGSIAAYGTHYTYITEPHNSKAYALQHNSGKFKLEYVSNGTSFRFQQDF